MKLFVWWPAGVSVSVSASFVFSVHSQVHYIPTLQDIYYRSNLGFISSFVFSVHSQVHYIPTLQDIYYRSNMGFISSFY